MYLSVVLLCMCVSSKQILSKNVVNEKSGKVLLKSFHQAKICKAMKRRRSWESNGPGHVFTPACSHQPAPASRALVPVLSLVQEEVVTLSLFFLLLLLLLSLLLNSVSSRGSFLICLQTLFLFLVQITSSLIDPISKLGHVLRN